LTQKQLERTLREAIDAGWDAAPHVEAWGAEARRTVHGEPDAILPSTGRSHGCQDAPRAVLSDSGTKEVI